MELFSDTVAFIDDCVWGWPMIIALIGTHIFMTFRTRFIQKKLFKAIKLSVAPSSNEDGLSQFEALTTALAGTIGSGNIVGVSTAILAGGPGAVLWMWLSGIFGMATKYSEAYIAIKYRVKDKHLGFVGGAMYALQRGLKHKKLGRLLAILFCIFTIFAALGSGATVQANSICRAVQYYSELAFSFEIPGWLIGCILATLVGIVTIGGVQKIGRVCSKLVPSMTVFYIMGLLLIIGINWQSVGTAISTIFISAFNPQAIFGGAVGASISVVLQYGFKRGLFSNESGLGTAPIVAAQAQTRNPARQALVSMTGTFWDTVIVCALTGIMVVTCLVAYPDLYDTYINTWTGATGSNIFTSGVELTFSCFECIPYIGSIILFFGLVTFAFSTILGWNAYTGSCIAYLLGRKWINVYYFVYLAFVFWGCLGGSELVWNISDICNALMATPNLVAVLALSGIVVKETKYYVYENRLDEYYKDHPPVVEK